MWHMIARMSGLIPKCFFWMSTANRRWWREFRPTISAPQVSFGETPFIDGTCWSVPATNGGSIVFAVPSSCSTWFDWITFGDSKRIGKFPAGASTAIGGKWVKGPGRKLFEILQNKLGDLPIIAENLGVITREVEAIQREFGFPGMSILQFAFGNDPQGPSFRPHNYSRELAAYTGVHDNDTTVGWWTSTGTGESTRTLEDIRKEHAFAKAYLAFENDPINWVFIRSVLASVALIAIIPLQDILGLGSEARMNLPGTVNGNWKWRYGTAALTAEIENRLQILTQMYDR